MHGGKARASERAARARAHALGLGRCSRGGGEGGGGGGGGGMAGGGSGTDTGSSLPGGLWPPRLRRVGIHRSPLKASRAACGRRPAQQLPCRARTGCTAGSPPGGQHLEVRSVHGSCSSRHHVQRGDVRGRGGGARLDGHVHLRQAAGVRGAAAQQGLAGLRPRRAQCTRQAEHRLACQVHAQHASTRGRLAPRPLVHLAHGGPLLAWQGCLESVCPARTPACCQCTHQRAAVVRQVVHHVHADGCGVDGQVAAAVIPVPVLVGGPAGDGQRCRQDHSLQAVLFHGHAAQAARVTSARGVHAGAWQQPAQRGPYTLAPASTTLTATSSWL